MISQCEFLERRRLSGEILEICALNGRFCFCLAGSAVGSDWRQCMRRLWALDHPQAGTGLIPDSGGIPLVVPDRHKPILGDPTNHDQSSRE